MKKIPFILLALALLTIAYLPSSSAQQASSEPKVTAEQLTDDTIQLMRQDIRAEKKKVVAANLPLTEAEAVKFWPVYDRYAADVTKVYDVRYALVKEYAQTYATMTDQQAQSFNKRWITADQALSELRLKWVPEFEKVISPKKTAMFCQIDRRLGLMIELQLASQVPLIKP